MLPGPLREYDRGPGAFAALVGGALQGVQAGYQFKQQIGNDREAKADRERKRLEDAIRLQMDMGREGVGIDDGSEPPASTPPARVGTPGFNPHAPDPRIFGDATPDLPGFAGLDPNMARTPEEVADPFRIDPGMARSGPSRNVDPGMAQGPGDLRRGVASVLLGNAPRIRKTGPSAQEERDSRLFANEAERDRQRYASDAARQTQAEQARAAEDALNRTERGTERKSANATTLEAARIAAGSREQVARLRPSAVIDPQQREIGRVTGLARETVAGLDRSIRTARAKIPRMTVTEEISPKDREAYDARHAGTVREIERLEAQRDHWQTVHDELVTRQMQGDFEFHDLLLGGTARSPREPQVDLRGRAMDRGAAPGSPAQRQVQPSATPSSGPPVGPNFAMDDERQMYESAAQKIMQLGLQPSEQQQRLTELARRYNERVAAAHRGDIDLRSSTGTPSAAQTRPLTPAERAKAQQDPGFAQFLQGKGYGPQDWR